MPRLEAYRNTTPRQLYAMPDVQAAATAAATFSRLAWPICAETCWIDALACDAPRLSTQIARISTVEAMAMVRETRSPRHTEPRIAPLTIMAPSVSGTLKAMPITPSDHWNATFPPSCPSTATSTTIHKTRNDGNQRLAAQQSYGDERGHADHRGQGFEL